MKTWHLKRNSIYEVNIENKHKKSVKAYKKLQYIFKHWKSIGKKNLKTDNKTALIRVENGSRITQTNPTIGKEKVVYDDTQIIDTKKELEDAIISTNKRHFTQAKNTSFITELLKNISDLKYNLQSNQNHKPIKLLL